MTAWHRVKSASGWGLFLGLCDWVLASGMVAEQDHPVAGRFKTVATPVKLSATPGSIRTPSPTLGEHTRQVLGEVGYSEEEIEALGRTGVI